MISIDIRKKLQGSQGSFELQIKESVSTHQFLGLYGRSGAGKTTLLRIFSGLEKPDIGIIEVNNEVWFDSERKIDVIPQKRNIGYVFQEDVLFANMSVKENLNFALRSNENKEFLEDLIEVMELEGLLNLKTHQLSGGQKQRISLARSLVQRPKILLLDEPLSALDFEMRKRLQQYILKAHENYELTTILVSHDPREMSEMVQQVWNIENGKVIKKGTPKEVLPEEVFK